MGKPGDDTAAPAVYQFAKRPAEITFCQFVYNSETGEILGRTPISWCKQNFDMVVDEIKFFRFSENYCFLYCLLLISNSILHCDAAGILPNPE